MLPCQPKASSTTMIISLSLHGRKRAIPEGSWSPSQVEKAHPLSLKGCHYSPSFQTGTIIDPFLRTDPCRSLTTLNFDSMDDLTTLDGHLAVAWWRNPREFIEKPLNKMELSFVSLISIFLKVLCWNKKSLSKHLSCLFSFCWIQIFLGPASAFLREKLLLYLRRHFACFVKDLGGCLQHVLGISLGSVYERVFNAYWD